MSRLSLVLRVSALSAMLAAPCLAQETTPTPVEPMPPMSRTVLQKNAVADSGYEAALVLVDIAPNVVVGRHTHSGNVSAYVVYGSIEVEIEGTAPRRFAAGESFTVPANTIHDERTGATGAKIVASFLVPVGAAMTTPVN